MPSDGLGEDFRNIDPLIATIIGARLATLNELRTIYDLEDAYDMWESIVIPRYNEFQADKEREKNRGRP